MILKHLDFSKEEIKIIVKPFFRKPIKILLELSDSPYSYIDYCEGIIYIPRSRSETEKRVLVEHEIMHLSFCFHEPLWHYLFKEEFKKEEFIRALKKILRIFPDANFGFRGLIRFGFLVFPEDKFYYCNLFEDLKINKKLRKSYPNIDQITGLNKLIDNVKEVEKEIRKMCLKACGDPTVVERMYKMISGKMSIGNLFNTVLDVVVCFSKEKNISSFLSESIEHLKEAQNDVLDSVADGIFRKSIEHRFKLEHRRLEFLEREVDKLDSKKVYNIIQETAPNLRENVRIFLKILIDSLMRRS